MKFTKQITLMIISTVLLTIPTAKSESSECDNPCQACQRTVYQLKFQKMADCGGTRCRNTCIKIKENWNNVNKTWDLFLKDIFGKCEICFRAGFCKISDCKAQEENELQIIAKVVNQSKLSAKLEDIGTPLGQNSLNGDPSVTPAQLAQATFNIDKTKRRLNTSLKAGVTAKNVKPAIEAIGSTLDSYFKLPFRTSGVTVRQNASESFESTLEAYRIFSAHVNEVIRLNKDLRRARLPVEMQRKAEALRSSTLADARRRLSDFQRLLARAKRMHRVRFSDLYANSFLDIINELKDFIKSLS